MPFTLLAHQAPVLPLARRSGGRLDGLALVAGSLAPDLAYALWFTRLDFDSHTLVALLWWSVPVAAAVAIATRRWIVGPLGPWLPALGAIHLRDLANLRRRRRSLVSTLLGGLIGASTHLALDAFTHHDGWVVERFAPLRSAVLGAPAWDLLQRGGSVALCVATLVLLRRYGRERWLGPPAGPAESRDRAALVGLLGGAVAGAALALATADTDGAIAAVVRALWVTWFGALVGGIAAAGRAEPPRMRREQVIVDRRGSERSTPEPRHR